MPFTYKNVSGVTNSQATLTLPSVQDWTKYGVKTLTLSFYGQPDNPTALPLYVQLTDQNGKSAQVVYGVGAGEAVTALAEPAWTTWNIPLAGFTNIALSAVKSLTIGMGPGSGSGRIYLDDIVLNPAVTPAAPMTPTLVGWWKLDNNVTDSSGQGNNGTINGTPTYVAAGKVGASLKLNGTTDYVDCGNGASLNMTDTVTVAAWIKGATLANGVYQTFIGKGDHAYVLQQVVTTNYFQLAIYDGTWYQCNTVAAVDTSMNGAWHHVAGTYDGTQIKVYIDGKVMGSLMHKGVIATNTFALTIGTNSEYTTARLFNGEMDDVRVYHGVLSSSDIGKLINP
jgi:hypothetical protein